MKRLPLAAALLLSAFAMPTAAETPAADPLSFVDPMIGTGGEGHTFPGATAPFGMVQLSPDTDTTCEIRDCYAMPPAIATKTRPSRASATRISRVRAIRISATSW